MIAIGSLGACEKRTEQGTLNSLKSSSGALKSLKSSSSALTVFVPAGAVGDNYWIYLNGHIASTPPHSSTDPTLNFTIVDVKDGIEFWNASGLAWRTRYGKADSPDRAPKNFFQGTNFSPSGGICTVEVAVLWKNENSSFPFVMTKDEVEVASGTGSVVYSGIPAGWYERGFPPVNRALCSGSPPDPDDLHYFLKAYNEDPILNAMRAAATVASPTNGVVTVDMPSVMGGSREFDARQLGYIVDAIREQHSYYTQAEVTSCRNHYPQFSRSYYALAQLIDIKDRDIDSLRKFVADVAQSSSHQLAKIIARDEPPSQSLCDMPEERGTAIYEKYCGQGGNAWSNDYSNAAANEAMQAAIRRAEAERKRKQQADEADQKGTEAATNGDWRQAEDWFSQAIGFAPDNPTIREHLDRATVQVADITSAENIVALTERTQDTLASAKIQATQEALEDNIAVERLNAVSSSLIIYPALGHPIPPDSPAAKVLEHSQEKIGQVDADIAQARAELLNLINSNTQSEEKRLQWIKVSEDMTIKAKDLVLSLSIDLIGAVVDELVQINHQERQEVLNHLLNRGPDGSGESIHAAYGMLVNQKDELKRIGQEVRLASKEADLKNKIRDFSMKDTVFTRDDKLDVISVIKKVDDLIGTPRDLLNAGYVIYKQAAAFENLAVIQADQEKTLVAAAELRDRIVTLEKKKRNYPGG
jgi:hypothetical protein